MEDDLRNRIRKSIDLLGLPDSEELLLRRFKAEKFSESFLKSEEVRTRTNKKQVNIKK